MFSAGPEANNRTVHTPTQRLSYMTSESQFALLKFFCDLNGQMAGGGFCITGAELFQRVLHGVALPVKSCSTENAVEISFCKLCKSKQVSR